MAAIAGRMDDLASFLLRFDLAEAFVQPLDHLIELTLNVRQIAGARAGDRIVRVGALRNDVPIPIARRTCRRRNGQHGLDLEWRRQNRLNGRRIRTCGGSRTHSGDPSTRRCCSS